MRIKRGKSHLKRRKNLLKLTKGYRWGRKSKIKLAKTAVRKAGAYAYRDRRTKKRLARRLWEIKINAAARELNTSYSKLMGLVHKAKVALDRKVLSQLAVEYPKVFAAVTAELK